MLPLTDKDLEAGIIKMIQQAIRTFLIPVEKEKIFATENRHKEKLHGNFTTEKCSSQNKKLGWIQEHNGDDRGKSR